MKPESADPAAVSEASPIERSFFRETQDGATVFFPWGLTRRGYLLRTKVDRRRAARAGTGLMGASVGIGTWAAHALHALLQEPAGLRAVLTALALPAAALGVVLVVYALWAWRFVEALQESDLRVSREERLREAAKLVAPWKVVGIGVVVAGAGALVAWLDPNGWWVGVLGIGLGLGMVGWGLTLRRIAATPPRAGGVEPIG